MPRNGWIALIALVLIFFGISTFVGSDGEEGILGQIANKKDAAATNAAVDQPELRSAAEMPDEVAAETEFDDFGAPLADEGFADDDEFIDSGNGFAPEPDAPPSAFPAGDSLANPVPQAGIAPTRSAPASRQSGNDALRRDLAAAGLISERPRSRRAE